MQTLILFLLSIFAFAAWIWQDEMTERVYDAFGRSFIYIWYNSGQRWLFMYMAVWRLLLFIAFPIICTWLARICWVDNPFGLSNFVNACCYFAVGLTGCLIFPWIRFNERRRMWSRARAAISNLAELVERLEMDPSIADELEAADYECVSPWKAWHPLIENFRNNTAWSGLTPVLYSNQKDSIAILQMNSMNIFLLRKNPMEIESFGEILPFDGPCQTKYKTVSSGRILRSPGWWYLNAQPQA